jgi:uncharacterized protein (TIGR02145 family)
MKSVNYYLISARSFLLRATCLRIFLLTTCTIGISMDVVLAQTAIGGGVPDESAMLDVQSINRGVLFPRMTTVQRNGINNGAPATGLMIFNTETGCLQINLGTPGAPLWDDIKCTPPGTVAGISNCGSPTLAGDHLMPTIPANGNSFTLNYTGGNGLSYEGQTINSTGVTGLFAELDAGTFNSGTGSVTYNVTGTPISSGEATFVLSLGGQACTVKLPVGCGAYVAAGDWRVFSCFNLGAADTNGDPFTLGWQVTGDYYVWGASTPSADGPTALSPNADAPATWPATANADNSWLDASKTANDPCPSGFRIPTKAQWDGVDNETLNPQSSVGTWTSQMVTDPSNYGAGRKFGPGLLLQATGYRWLTDGALFSRGTFAGYWSSTAVSSTTLAWVFYLSQESPNTNDNQRRFGYSIRCIKDDSVVIPQ